MTLKDLFLTYNFHDCTTDHILTEEHCITITFGLATFLQWGEVRERFYHGQKTPPLQLKVKFHNYTNLKNELEEDLSDSDLEHFDEWSVDHDEKHNEICLCFIACLKATKRSQFPLTCLSFGCHDVEVLSCDYCPN